MFAPKHSEKTPKKVAVAIVGAGIAGLYCGFEIQKLLQDPKLRKEFMKEFIESDEQPVLIFEASSRPGGRISTRRIPASPIPNETHSQKAKEGNTGEPDLSGMEFYAEFGPMRIEEDQRLLHRLLRELGIEEREMASPSSPKGAHLVPFPAFNSPVSTHEPKYELVGAEKDQRTPWDLMLLAFARVLRRLEVSQEDPQSGAERDNESPEEKRQRRKSERDCLLKKLENLHKLLDLAGSSIMADPGQWKFKFEDWIGHLEEEHYQHLREYATFDGEPLWGIGFWNLLSDILSHDAVMKLRDLGTFYHLIPENPNAAEWLIFWLRNIKGSNALKGVYGGMECIIERLTNHLDEKKGAKLLSCRKLTKIAPEGDRVLLTFQITDGNSAKTEVYSAKQVILAMPKAPLQKLALTNSQVFPGEIVEHLEDVFGFPMVKVFIVVKRRWWEEEYRANLYATRVPTRELHYWKSLKPDSRRGMIMIYTDRPASSFWANYVKTPGKQDEPEVNGPAENNRLITKILQYLRENDVQNISKDDVEWYGIRDWGREPYLGANHAWRPERKSWVALRKLSQFHLAEGEQQLHHECDSKCKRSRNIHICGEAYSDYHGFIEGSLRSSKHVLHVMGFSNRTETPWLCGCQACKSKAANHAI